MAHAPTDAPPPPRRPAPPPRPRVPVHDTPPPQHVVHPTTAQQGVADLFNHGNHDTPPHAPGPTYSPGHITKPTSTLDQVLAAGKGPLNLPAGKINIPRAPRQAPPLRSFTPQLPQRGARQPLPTATPQEIQQTIARATTKGRAQASRYPGWAQGGIVDANVADSLLMLAAHEQIDSKTAHSLWNAMSNLPTEERARVFESLPGVDPGQREAVRELQRFAHPGGFSGLINNFRADALHTPQGIFLGGYTTAQALDQAAHGNYGPIQQVAGATISPFTSTKNFKNFLYEHPFQAALTASGVGRAAGAVAGAGVRGAARVGIGADSGLARALSGNAPRTLTRTIGTREAGAGEDITRTLNLGNYSKNAVVQGMQRLGNHAYPFSRRVAAEAENVRQMTRAEREAAIRDRVEPIMDQMRHTSGAEQQAATYAHAQGLNPSDLVSHYQERVSTLEDTVSTATGQARSRAVRELKTVRGALKTWQHIYNKVGDEVTPEMEKLLGAARAGVTGREQDLIQAGLLDRSVAAKSPFQPRNVVPSTNPRESPFYVHHEPLNRPGSSRIFGRRRPAPGEGQGPTTSLMQRSGSALASGNLDVSMKPFLRNLAEPDNRVAAIQEVEALRQRFGTPVKPDDHLHADQILMPRETVVGSGSPSSIVSANFVTTDRGVVPPGDWVAVPKSAVAQTRRQFNPRLPGTGQQVLKGATQAFKWNVLLTRPAWLMSNVVGNTAEALLGGAGPVSAYRALDKTGRITSHLPGRDYGDVIPKNTENAGFFARQLAPKKGVLPSGMSNPLVRGNVTHENWLRRALYLRHAIPEYGKDIHALTEAKTAEERAPVVVKTVDRFLGNFAHHTIGDNAVLAFPFIRWLEFITKQTLYDLPVHHPMRALLLYRLGTLGNIASEESQGLANPSTEGGIPLPSSILDLLGQARNGPVGPVSAILRTGALNPWATVSQLGGFSSVEPTGQPSFSGVLSSLSPFIQAPISAATGHEFSNPQFPSTANPNTTTQAAYLGNELLNLFPSARLVFGSTNFGGAPRGQLQQPQPSFWSRLLGYNLAGISPVDLGLQNMKNFRAFTRQYATEQRHH